jgi:hypothetical protein
MNASDIIRLLNTSHYAPADLDEVNKLCREFPEFSTAHLLKVRVMEALGYEKQDQLKVAAVYSMNRTKLLQLVTEVKQTEKPEPEAELPAENTDIIEFSEESNEDADLIIEQHAPYAGPEPETETELLELDEDATDELLDILDEEAEEEAEEVVEEEAEEEAEEHPHEEADEEETVEEKAVEEETVEEHEDEVSDEQPKKYSNHLITSFISGEPGPIRADQETSLKGDVSRASHREHDGFITDTLAQIYVKQGLYAKAIYAYEKLSLKYPEKSAYFAAQIEKIRNINHS